MLQIKQIYNDTDLVSTTKMGNTKKLRQRDVRAYDEF